VFKAEKRRVSRPATHVVLDEGVRSGTSVREIGAQVTDDPEPARITVETMAFVVLTMMSAGRSSDTVMVMSFSVHAQRWS
jgi:hypothetical protein